MDDQPVTVSELKQSGRRLGMRCLGCNRFRYLGMDRYEDETVISEIGKTLICRRCRMRNLDVMIIDRDAETGFWPAEYS